MLTDVYKDEWRDELLARTRFWVALTRCVSLVFGRPFAQSLFVCTLLKEEYDTNMRKGLLGVLLLALLGAAFVQVR
jgi:pyruvate-formate lyase-activating enzyme